MIGLGVYNEQNEHVGDINEVLFDRSGRVEGVVIGVGGFLGLGERNVAVPYNDLRWSMNRPGGNTAGNERGDATAGGNGSPGATGANPGAVGSPAATGLGGAVGTGNTTMASTNGNRPAAYPDHAILPNASKEQLNSAPRFNYGQSPR